MSLISSSRVYMTTMYIPRIVFSSSKTDTVFLLKRKTLFVLLSFLTLYHQHILCDLVVVFGSPCLIIMAVNGVPFIPPGKDRWLPTPISLGLSWPLPFCHLLGVASHRSFHQSVDRNSLNWGNICKPEARTLLVQINSKSKQKTKSTKKANWIIMTNHHKDPY